MKDDAMAEKTNSTTQTASEESTTTFFDKLGEQIINTPLYIMLLGAVLNHIFWLKFKRPKEIEHNKSTKKK